MGKLLSLLKQDSVVSTDAFIDFEKAQPIDQNETEIYLKITEKFTQKSQQLLQELKDYKGCGEFIRRAISQPSKESEDLAWRQVCPQVKKLKEFFLFSTELEECFTSILLYLFDSNKSQQQQQQQQQQQEGTTTQESLIKSSMERNQALCRLLCNLLVFALDFDEYKTLNPSIQNDFSYYRRTLSRLKMNNQQDLLDLAEVKDELANKMSLFYAYPTPMLKTLVDSLCSQSTSSSSSLPAEKLLFAFSLIVQICHVAVSDAKFQAETLQFCLRVMVGCIILYDHLDLKGCFHKDSEINIKSHIKLIQNYGGPSQEQLLNAIRYTTKHLNDEQTPKAVKQMLGLTV